jgi:hypothetical protein
MKKLNYELRNLVKRNRDGSHATQADRHRYLQNIANQLQKLGYRNMGVSSLKTKHIWALVRLWKGEVSSRTGKPISNGAIKNRMANLRWWAGKIDKANVVPRKNKELGIEYRRRLPESDKAFTLSETQIKDLPKYFRLSIRLQQEFGLRREEAAKFDLSKAEKEGSIRLLPSWTKGGRERVIPIVTKEQKELLKDIKDYAPKSSLIPMHMNFAHYLWHRKYIYASAKIPATHGLRHHYAQQRYLSLTNGALPPRMGGRTHSKLSEAEKEVDMKARLIVSSELGHARIDITRVYLG